MSILTVVATLGAIASTPQFGPFGDDAHPVAGRVDVVPGQGSWEYAPRLRGEVELEVARQAVRRHRGGSNPLYLAYLGYRYFISPSDGARCQHYPTCSHYGVLAVRRHGVLGILMTIDRLWQSGQPTAIRPYPVVRVFGSPRFYDPVEASDFWFTDEEPH